jgi:tRNA A37 methylthiotransferase MiaB
MQMTWDMSHFSAQIVHRAEWRWWFGTAEDCRSACRYCIGPSLRGPSIGFRVVLATRSVS